MRKNIFAAISLLALSLPALCRAEPASYRFSCHAANAAKKVGEDSFTNDYADVSVVIAGNSVTLALAGGGTSYSGAFDANYKPRTNKNMVRVSYDDDGQDSVIHLLLEKQMLEGKDGSIKITDMSFEMPGNYIFQVDACKGAQ